MKKSPVIDIEGLLNLDKKDVIATVMQDGSFRAGLILPADIETYTLLPSTVRGLVKNTVGYVMLFEGERGKLEFPRRVKVAYGFSAHAPQQMSEWQTPKLSSDELKRGISRVIVPSIIEVRRALNTSSARTRIVRDYVIAENS